MLKFSIKANKDIFLKLNKSNALDYSSSKKTFCINSEKNQSLTPNNIQNTTTDENLPIFNNIFTHLNEINLISNLSNRELLTNPNYAKEFLNHNPNMYIGFDPTAESLHLGNLVGIITALRFASFGITPIFLIGGATGQIGDPSGKNKERPLLEIEKVKQNLDHINLNIQNILRNISEFKDFKEFDENTKNSVYLDSSYNLDVINLETILKEKIVPNNIFSNLNYENQKNLSLNKLLKNSSSILNNINHNKSSVLNNDFIKFDLIDEQINLINLLSLDENEKQIKKMNLLKSRKNIKYKIIDNMEFYKDLSIVEFLRNIGTSLRMGPMLSRECIKTRLNSSDGMSLTEFMYQSFQGYDFLKLFELHNVRIQIGGSDQWGNMLAGYELIKKTKNIDVINLTFPLLTTSNGQKFGKSEGNAFFLNESMTPINNIYQYFYNIADGDLEKLYNAFTFIQKKEIDDIINFHNSKPENRNGQKILAEKIITMLYSEEESIKCRKKSQTHYLANKINEENKTEINVDEMFKDMEIVELPDDFLENKIKISQFCLDFKLLDTKAACKRLVQSGSLIINNNKVDSDVVLCKEMLLGGKYFVVKTGKKHTHVFSVRDKNTEDKKEDKSNSFSDYSLKKMNNFI